MKYSFLKEEKFGLREQVTFIGNKMNIYLTKSSFEVKPTLATIIGDKVETIGVFWFETGGKWYQLQLAIPITFQYREKVEKSLVLRPGLSEDKYWVFTLERGDAFIYDTNNKRDIEQVKFFFGKLLEGAKMPKYVPYPSLLQLFLNALEITASGNLEVSSLTFEFLLAALYRGQKNYSKEFRQEYNGNNPFAYKMVRIVSLTRAASTFTSIIGEDLQTSLVAGILRTRQKQVDAETPIEKIIKY